MSRAKSTPATTPVIADQSDLSGAQAKFLWRSTASLTPHPKNPRKHSRQQVRAIARSIKTFGFNAPILIDRDGRIIGGHGRFEAAKLLGLDKVPVVILDHLNENEARAYTQSFNTTNSMGRLTLNVLLSFAQFEREVIGERVRDKIAASKAKGIWVGGAIPLGYASVDKKLVVVTEKADTVRLIFRRYLELASIRDLAEDLERKGVRTRRQQLSNGQTRGGIRFGVGTLGHLLRNRFYIGEVVYRGAVHAADHDPILDRALFDAVQDKLAASASARQLKLKASPALLAGRIFDHAGNRMSPTHTNKRGARYRYYVSHTAFQKKHDKTAHECTRVNAADIESLVAEVTRSEILKGASDALRDPIAERELIERFVENITVKSDTVEISLAGIEQGPQPCQVSTESAAPFIISVPWTRPTNVAAKGIVHSPSTPPATSRERDTLLMAIAKARGWIDDLTSGRAASFAEIAKQEDKCERHIRLLAPLAFVSPTIIADLIDGPTTVPGVTKLAHGLPYAWYQQRLGESRNGR